MPRQVKRDREADARREHRHAVAVDIVANVVQRLEDAQSLFRSLGDAREVQRIDEALAILRPGDL